MKATKEIVETRVREALSATPHKAFTVDKNLEPYALYNALVGTTFDEESYRVLAESEEGVQYLYDHIPGGAKLIKEGEQAEESVTEQEQTPDATPAKPEAEPKAEPNAEPKAEPEAEPEVEPKAEPNAEPKVKSESETTTVPEVTPEEVEAHKGEEVTEENEKFDIDNDGDIDDDDVAKASEIEVA